jgi:hypothetical protein
MNATKICLSLGLILCAWEASAEPLYSISPRIPAHTRDAQPMASPLLSAPEPMSPQKAALQPRVETQTTARIDVKPSPDIPVSDPTDAMGQPDAHMHPATLELPPAPPMPMMEPPAPPLSPQSLRTPGGALDTRAVEGAPMASSGTRVADAAMTTAPPQTGGVTQTQTAASSGKEEKPVVHFPEALAPDDSPAVNTTDAAPDKRIYPVGYKPYTPPTSTDQRRWLETAITHYNRAGYYQERNDLDAAIDEYKQAIRFDQTFADAYVGLSSTFMRKNDWENVVESANQALNKQRRFMEPANIGQAWFNLSTAYCVADDRRWAAKYYEKAKLAGHPALGSLSDFLKKNCSP